MKQQSNNDATTSHEQQSNNDVAVSHDNSSKLESRLSDIDKKRDANKQVTLFEQLLASLDSESGCEGTVGRKRERKGGSKFSNTHEMNGLISDMIWGQFLLNGEKSALIKNIWNAAPPPSANIDRNIHFFRFAMKLLHVVMDDRDREFLFFCSKECLKDKRAFQFDAVVKKGAVDLSTKMFDKMATLDNKDIKRCKETMAGLGSRFRKHCVTNHADDPEKNNTKGGIISFMKTKSK